MMAVKQLWSITFTNGTLNILLWRIRRNCNFNLDFKPVFYKLYVDNCIICLPKTKTKYILNQFNHLHPKLQFTVEEEQQNRINFLDLTL